MAKVINIADRRQAAIQQKPFKYSVTFRMHNLVSAVSKDEVENIIIGIIKQTEAALTNLEVVNYTIEEVSDG
jgi:hypothetical protein